MAGWHHWLDGHESEWPPGSRDGQGGLVCCDSWGRKELDMTERLKWMELKKIEKTTRPFRYDLNQIPHKYTVEVINRFKGLDLINSAWRTMDRGSWHCTGGRDQDHSQEKEMQKGKMVAWGGLTNSWEKKRSERQRRKRKIYPLNTEFQRIGRREKKAFLSEQRKEIDKNKRMGKTRDLLKIPREHFKQRWAQ